MLKVGFILMNWRQYASRRFGQTQGWDLWSRSGTLQKYGTGILLLGRRQSILEYLSVFGGIMQVGALIYWNGAFTKGDPKNRWIGVVMERNQRRDKVWLVRFPTTTQWVVECQMEVLCK